MQTKTQLTEEREEKVGTNARELNARVPHRTVAEPARRIRSARVPAFGLLALSIALGAGFIPRWRTQRAIVEQTRLLAFPTVSIVLPERGQDTPGVALPAELAAFTEARIYARANGYLKRWLVDLGDHVAAGQLLAEIDAPELDQELARSRAEVMQAEAALELAKTTAVRWTELVKTASVSTQETAEKQADLALKSAGLEAARANVRRLEQLRDFTRVVAPFEGTVAARRTDVGQLITADRGQELFRLAQTSKLLVFVHVPQGLSRAVELGQAAELSLPEIPGQVFRATVVRTAGVIEADSRTLVTELEVDNQRGELMAGSYAQVRFIDARVQRALTLPSNTLLFRSEGMQIGVVSASDKVELRKVRLGRDFGQTVEVLEGLAPTERVILNPSDSLVAGTTVRIAAAVARLAAK